MGKISTTLTQRVAYVVVVSIIVYSVIKKLKPNKFQKEDHVLTYITIRL
jgi:hypothetical protein